MDSTPELDDLSEASRPTSAQRNLKDAIWMPRSHFKNSFTAKPISWALWRPGVGVALNQVLHYAKGGVAWAHGRTTGLTLAPPRFLARRKHL